MENGGHEKSEDKQYAEQLFHKHLKFRDGTYKAAHINLSKVAPKDAKTNFISLAQLKSNNLLKVQRTVLFCIEYLVKTSPKRMLTTKDDSPNCSGGENSVDYFWAMYNRKWYVVQKATDEETPDELRNKNLKKLQL